MADLLREDGIEVLLQTDARALRTRRRRAAVVRAHDGERALDGSHVLVAAGRVPNTDALDLSRGRDRRSTRRGSCRRTSGSRRMCPASTPWATCSGGPQFTHISYDDYRVLKANLLENGAATIADRLVPYTVFIDPQLGRIGMTEEEARASGRPIRVATMPMSSVARALEVDESARLHEGDRGYRDQPDPGRRDPRH